MNKLHPLLRILVYATLIGGSIVFSFPFIWMASSSVKVDREMLAQQDTGLTIMPAWPLAERVSPYIDKRYFTSLNGPYQRQLLPKFQSLAKKTGFTVPGDVNRHIAWQQIARGLYRKLHRVLPGYLWKGQLIKDWGSTSLGKVVGHLKQSQTVDRLVKAASHKVNRALVAQTFNKICRRFELGPLLARSFGAQQVRLGRGQPISQRLTNRTPGTARIKTVTPSGQQPVAVVHYDFHHGDKVVLQHIFTLPFKASQLKRLEMIVTPDNSWHDLTCRLETPHGVYVAARSIPLAEYNSETLIWQKPTAADHSTKIKTWVVLQPTGARPAVELASNQIRVTFTLNQVSRFGAILNKIKRNYQQVFDQIPFWRYLRVSTFLVVANIVLTLLFSSLTAYAFARLTWPGRDLCFVLMLATMMIPPQVVMIPQFLIWRDIGAYNTLTPLWATSIFGSAFFIFLLRQFMKGIPRDLEDAARIDGCGFLRIYWYVFLPLMKPALAAIAIFTFMGTWNNFMGPLIYVADQRLYPLAFGLYAFSIQVGNDPALTMAASLLMTLPVIAIFFFAQKYFIQGITLTGMKG